MATNARDVRITWPIVGVGGNLDVEWQGSASDPGVPTGAGFGKLEVEQWEIIHDNDLAELPLSGGEGAMTRFLVGDDFEVICNVLLDMKPALDDGAANTFAGQPFLDGRLQGNVAVDANFYFRLTLQVGDPAIWSNAPGDSVPVQNVEPFTGLQYRCQKVLLRQTRTVDNSKGDPPDGCVRSFVRLAGSAPLERWIDNIPVGKGGLGFKLTAPGGGGLFDIKQ